MFRGALYKHISPIASPLITAKNQKPKWTKTIQEKPVTKGSVDENLQCPMEIEQQVLSRATITETDDDIEMIDTCKIKSKLIDDGYH
jgi:hypothetical protein